MQWRRGVNRTVSIGLGIVALVVTDAGVRPSSALLAASQPDGRHALVARVGAYVDAWERDLGSVVADETYRQTVVRTLRSGSIRGMSGPPQETRELVSEFTLVHIEDGGSDWIGVRTVRRVNGKAVAIPGPTLSALLNDARLSWTERWARARDMSAAFNLGSFARDVNVPTFLLAALRTANQARFEYSSPRTERVDGEWLTAFDLSERSRPTVVSGLGGRDVPIAGRVWCDSTDGRVRRTELTLRDRVMAVHEPGAEHGDASQTLNSRITVRFVADANVGAWVPAEMRERYDNAWEEVTTGQATYANYRRFRTSGRILRPGH